MELDVGTGKTRSDVDRIHLDLIPIRIKFTVSSWVLKSHFKFFLSFLNQYCAVATKSLVHVMQINTFLFLLVMYYIWDGHIARMGEESGVYRVLVGKPEGKRPLGRPRRRWVDNVGTDLQEVGCGYMD